MFLPGHGSGYNWFITILNWHLKSSTVFGFWCLYCCHNVRLLAPLPASQAHYAPSTMQCQRVYIFIEQCLYSAKNRVHITVETLILSLLSGYEFPVDFIPMVRKIFRTYFAILAHIYHHHFHDIRALDLHDGLNSLFLHFVYFVQEFSLVDAKEMQCVDDLIQKLMQLDKDMAKCPSTEEFIDAGKASSQLQKQTCKDQLS